MVLETGMVVGRRLVGVVAAVRKHQAACPIRRTLYCTMDCSHLGEVEAAYRSVVVRGAHNQDLGEEGGSNRSD